MPMLARTARHRYHRQDTFHLRKGNQHEPPTSKHPVDGRRPPALPLMARAAAPAVDVYKSATCGCCHKWVDHLRANGFNVTAHDVADPGLYRAKA
ncbi:hypothetical protein LP420_41140 [Massilia sp. B-10]|nr:hypothetical protein LP420_41140 [Massilia sp. B-10]